MRPPKFCGPVRPNTSNVPKAAGYGLVLYFVCVVRQRRTQTMTIKDITWWNLSNEVVNLAISYKYAVSFFHVFIAVRGRHGLGPLY